MAKSPFLRGVCFWGSFYLFYNYSSRDPVTNRQNFPSYAIFKEKIIRDTWRDGFNADKLSTDYGHFGRAFKDEIKGLLK
jgi:hypothetical protein